MRSNFALFCATWLALTGCSINDDLRQFQESVPERVQGLAWLELVPLGSFESLAPIERAPDTRSMAARAASLRIKAARLRGRPVLDPQRAWAMRTALIRFNS